MTRMWIEHETVPVCFSKGTPVGFLAQFKGIEQIDDSELPTAQTEKKINGWMDGHGKSQKIINSCTLIQL